MSGSETIFDPEFNTGDSALFQYGLGDDAAMVKVLAKVNVHGDKWYAVSAHQTMIDIMEVAPSKHYSLYFKEEIPNQHLVFLADPDELDYPQTNFRIINGGFTPEEE